MASYMELYYKRNKKKKYVNLIITTQLEKISPKYIELLQFCNSNRYLQSNHSVYIHLKYSPEYFL